MKISLKIAIAASVLWFVFVLLGGWTQLKYLSSDQEHYAPLQFGGLFVIWLLYVVFQKNIDAKSHISPDDLYEKLLKVIGCGPATAQRITEKVQADQELTNREQNFWNEVN